MREIEPARIGASVANALTGWGAVLVGYADLRGRLDPLPFGLASAVSIAVKLSDAVVDPVVDGPTYLYGRHYGVANALLDSLSFRTAQLLEEMGWRALPVPATYHEYLPTLEEEVAISAFPHKTAATLAGLGWIGKSALLITPERGPRVRLATVLTDAPLPAAGPVTASSCGNCRVCVERCPAGALGDALWRPGLPREEMVDAHACRDWMRAGRAGSSMVCGICLAVCPRGRTGAGTSGG